MADESTGKKIMNFIKDFFVGNLEKAWQGILGSISSVTSLLKNFNIGGESIEKVEQTLENAGNQIFAKTNKARGEALTGAEAAIEQYFADNQATFAGVDASIVNEVKAQTIQRAKTFIKNTNLTNVEPVDVYSDSLEFRDGLKVLLAGDQKKPGLLPVGMANRDAVAAQIAYAASGIKPEISSDAKAADLLAQQPTGGLAGMLALLVAAFSAEGFDEQAFTGSSITMPKVTAGQTMPNTPPLPESMKNTNPQNTTGPGMPLVKNNIRSNSEVRL